MIRRRAGLPAAELRLFAILRHLEYEYAIILGTGRMTALNFHLEESSHGGIDGGSEGS